MNDAMDETTRKLQAAAGVVHIAVLLLRSELPILEAFLKEARDIDSFGHIINPTLYRNPERRAVSDTIEPVFKAAVELVEIYDAQMKAALPILAQREQKA